MIVAIHQPNYLPWLGYFYKIAKCDIFVLLSKVQYSKNGYTNRCKIKTSQREKWLTVNVLHRGKFGCSINEIEIVDLKFGKVHEKTLETNYKKAAWFKRYFPFFQDTYSQEWRNIAELNEAFIRLICQLLGIKTKIIIDSELAVSGSSTELLVNICKAIGGTTYFSGLGGKNYMNEKLFLENGIDVRYSNFKHPIYNQLWGEFVPAMSIIDLLFNEGENSLNILTGAK